MKCLVLGGAGFIGMALTRRLKEEGHWVRTLDVRNPPFEHSIADEPLYHDLRRPLTGELSRAPGGQEFDEVYQFACNMGGAGYIFTGEHDADVMRDNVLINANVAHAFTVGRCGRLLYTSSSCVYNDIYADSTATYMESRLVEGDINHSPPSNGYGWEKLFSEKLYEAYRRNHGLNVCITRFSTIYGPGSPFNDGREKAVAAIIRKVLDAPHDGEVEVWGDGEQVRPLVYIDDLLDAVTGLMRCKTHNGPMNIASEEFTTCDEIARQAILLSNKGLRVKHVPGPVGKQELRMSTDLATKHLKWTPRVPFVEGIEKTFEWIARQNNAQRAAA